MEFPGARTAWLYQDRSLGGEVADPHALDLVERGACSGRGIDPPFEEWGIARTTSV